MFFPSVKIYGDISTKRLILREPLISDADDIFELCSTLDATRFVDWYPHTDKKQSLAYIRYLRRQKALFNLNSYTWFVENEEDKKVIATISLTELDSSGKIATVGYTLNQRYQHKGYATEALLGLMKYLFQRENIERIQAKVLPENLSSVKLLKRVGMKQEALLKKGVSIKNELRDLAIYGILKDEFFSLKPDV